MKPPRLGHAKETADELARDDLHDLLIPVGRSRDELVVAKHDCERKIVSILRLLNIFLEICYKGWSTEKRTFKFCVTCLIKIAYFNYLFLYFLLFEIGKE